VPLPHDARPTDFERDVAGLEHATYITADIAYRRDALVRSGGFDECFPLAYREDADLALRVLDLGWSIERGTRVVSHPVGAARFGASIRRQRGNASDARMRRKHGPRWRARARAGRGRLPVHGVTVGMAVLAVAAAPRAPRVAGLAAAVWLAATAQFAWTRLRPGPRTIREVATVVGTSVVIPFAAVHHRLRC
jgi:hypothetical protein